MATEPVIQLQQVYFSYAGPAVLEGIDLQVQAGEFLGVVGPNGAGKTTLIKLLCRLYDPSMGTITVDGIDLRQFETAALRICETKPNFSSAGNFAVILYIFVTKLRDRFHTSKL